MDLIYKGMLWGLLLTIMVGPIVIGLVQTSIEKGWKPGIRVAFGVWISDFLFITACYWFTKPLDNLIQAPGFTLWLGIIGGLVLGIIGIGMFFKKVTFESLNLQFQEANENNIVSFTKGFLINTINPFTFIFWITISLTIISKEAYSPAQAFLFYSSIMFVVMLGDSLKVFLAHKIRPWLTPGHVNNIRLVSGIAFIIFGLVMILRVL